MDCDTSFKMFVGLFCFSNFFCCSWSESSCCRFFHLFKMVVTAVQLVHVLEVFSGFWFFDMSDEVREGYLRRPGDCPSQHHDNITTLTTLHREYRLFEWFRLLRLRKFFRLLPIVAFCT